MSDDGLEPLSAGARALIDAESRRPDGAPDQASRILERLTTSINLGVGPGGGGDGGGNGGGVAGTASAVGSALSARAVAAVLGAFLLGGGAGAALHAQLTPSTSTSVPLAPATASQPVVSTSIPAIPVSALSEAVSSPSSSSSASSSSARPPLPAPSEALADRDTSLSRERAMIDRSRMAAARHDRAGALAALDEHAREFPRGRLVEEREALAIGALADLGRMSEARERAARFRTRHPTSVFLPAVSAVLDREKKDSAP